MQQHQQNAETKTPHSMQCFDLIAEGNRTDPEREEAWASEKWGPAYAVDENQYSQARTDGIAVRTAQRTLGRVASRTFKTPRRTLLVSVLRAMIILLGDHSSMRWVPRRRWLFHRSLFHLAN
ncbi:unnamed protein product [Sphagnum troendelagicum]|uniref:Uncharacterized protein n=1 Tax=Sphagnum troendelagicum TaxID=128251 RepID=A0ABP0T851_9BRYO